MPVDLLTTAQRAALIKAGAATPEDFIPTRPQPTPNFAEGGRVSNRGQRMSPDGPLEVLKGLFGMMGSAGRGAIATTLGFPGDMTRLGYALTGNEQPPRGTTLFPDSSDIKRNDGFLGVKFLPKLPLDMRFDAYDKLGSMVPLSPGQGYKLATSPLGKGALTALAASHGLPMGGALGMIKPTGGQWLNGEVEKALKGYLRHADDPELRAALLQRGGDPQQLDDSIAKALVMDNWIKGPFTKYLKRDFASPSDPIRKLADEGILHINPDDLNTNLERSLYRELPKQEIQARNPSGLKWETAADKHVGSMPAGFAQGKTLEKNPWIKTLPQETNINTLADPDGMGGDLGFDHLMDEVYNSLQAGEINPEHMKNGQFSVDAAVRHVANKTAQQAKDAEKAKLDQLSKLTSGKTYPNGYRWAEIPDTSDSEALALCKSLGLAGGWCTQQDWAAKNYGSNGKKLHVLLDPDGRPHAQVNVQPGFDEEDYIRYIENVTESMDEPQNDAFWNYMEGAGEELESKKRALNWILDNASDVDTAPDTLYWLDKVNHPGNPVITQIKPRANSWESQMVKDQVSANPNYRDEITPMLQDFVRSSEWGDVKDQSMANLYHKSLLTPEEQAIHQGHEYLTIDEISKMRDGKPWYPLDRDPDLNFANGGLVNFDDLQAFLAPR